LSMPRREQLLAMADQAKADAEKLEAAAALARHQEATLRRLAAELEEPLRAIDTDDTLARMDVNTNTERAKRGAGRATRKHRGQRKLYEKGHSVTSIAAELGEGRPRVSAWFADGEANRPIPRRHAEYLRDKYNIPLTSWKRIAD
jgi:hypothetical protein